MKECEGRLGALLGANGAIYAIRRSGFSGINGGTIVDDLVIPLVMHLRYRLPHRLRPIGSRTRGDGAVFDHGVSTSRAHRRRWISQLVARRAASHGRGTGGSRSRSSRTSCCAGFARSGCSARWRPTPCSPTIRSIGSSLRRRCWVMACRRSGWHHRTHGWRVVRLSTMFTTMNAALLVGFWMWASGTADRHLAADREVRPMAGALHPFTLVVKRARGPGGSPPAPWHSHVHFAALRAARGTGDVDIRCGADGLALRVSGPRLRAVLQSGVYELRTRGAHRRLHPLDSGPRQPDRRR